jgi:hypothetical protein
MNTEIMGQEESNETKIALIAKDIGYIVGDVKEIKQNMQNLSGVFVQSIQYTEDKKASDMRIERLEKSSNLWRWLSPTLASVAGAVLTLLVISYLSNIGR